MSRRSKTIEDDENEDWDKDDHSMTAGGKERYRGRDHGGSDDDDNKDQDSGRKSRRGSGSKKIPYPVVKASGTVYWCAVTVQKSYPRQDPGLEVEARNGKYYVQKVHSGGLFGLFDHMPIRAGDRILDLNKVDSREFRNVNELMKLLKEEPRFTVRVLRREYDDWDESVSSSEEEEEEEDVGDINGVNELTPMKKDAA